MFFSSLDLHEASVVLLRAGQLHRERDVLCKNENVVRRNRSQVHASRRKNGTAKLPQETPRTGYYLFVSQKSRKY